jgi:DNA polymerase sigma
MKLMGYQQSKVGSFAFYQVANEKRMRMPFINTAVKKVAHSLQVLWPRSRTKIFGSNATGLALPSSDVDLVVSLPPVRKVSNSKTHGD